MIKTLKDIGERSLIELINSIISKDDFTHTIGDDCAFIPLDDRYILVSTDMVSQSTHFSSVMDPRDMGWFVTAINLSDIAAKGGIPLGVLLAYGFPRDMSVSDFEELVEGAHACASAYHTSIIGGDTKEHNEIVISGTSIGVVDKQEYMSRAGAKEGDVIAVTGYLGKAAAGFLSIQKGKIDKKNIQGLIHPIPRISEGRKLAQSKMVHCCMDISDGLSSSLYQLQKYNNVGFSVVASELPIYPVLESICDDNDLRNKSLLHFGGEYELLMCIPAESFSALQDALKPTHLTAIGRVTRDTSIKFIQDGVVQTLENKGYEHFVSHIFS